MPPKFVLTGTYTSFNKGDAAMELCAVEQLREHFDGAEVVISSPEVEIDRPFYRGTRVVASSRRRLVMGSLRVAQAFAWRRLRDTLGVELPLLFADEETRAFVDADLVIDLSGDMLTEDYGPHVAYSHFLPLLLALALRKKVFVCAQSIGPFRWTRPLARFVLNRASRITARDDITQRYLDALDIEPRLRALTADLAFLLRPATDDRARDILVAEGVDPAMEGPWLGVSMSRLVADKYDRAHPGESFVAVVGRALDELVARFGFHLLFVAHVTGPRPEHDDRRIGSEIAGRLRDPSRVHVLRGDHRPDELKALIRRCTVFLGARMHANIAALSSGVPTVAIAYSHKAPGIMELFGQRGRALPVADVQVDTLVEAIADITTSRETVQAELVRALETVSARSRENLRAVEELLGRI